MGWGAGHENVTTAKHMTVDIFYVGFAMNWCLWRSKTVTWMQVWNQDRRYGLRTSIGLNPVNEGLLSKIAVQSFAESLTLSQWRNITPHTFLFPWIVDDDTLATKAPVELSRSSRLPRATTSSTTFCGRPIVLHYLKANWTNIKNVGRHRVMSHIFHPLRLCYQPPRITEQIWYKSGAFPTGSAAERIFKLPILPLLSQTNRQTVWNC